MIFLRDEGGKRRGYAVPLLRPCAFQVSGANGSRPVRFFD